jgi:hypothetical protein
MVRLRKDATRLSEGQVEARLQQLGFSKAKKAGLLAKLFGA